MLTYSLGLDTAQSLMRSEEGLSSAVYSNAAWPVSESRTDMSDHRLIEHPKRRLLAPLRKPMMIQSTGGTSCVGGMSSTVEKRLLVWTASGAAIKCLSNESCVDRRDAMGRAVYSYTIVNQRLSHIAAFVPPRVTRVESSQIAYRFVFTNTL